MTIVRSQSQTELCKNHNWITTTKKHNTKVIQLL